MKREIEYYPEIHLLKFNERECR